MADAHARHRSRVAQGGFTALENVYLFDASLSPGALRLYAALKHYAWKNDGEIPPQVELAAAIASSERSIRDDFKRLEARGMVTIERKQGAPSRVIIEQPDNAPANLAGAAPADFAGVHRQFLPGFGLPSPRAREKTLKTALSNESAHVLICKALTAACYPAGAKLTDRENRQVGIAARNIASADGTPEMVALVRAAYQRHSSYAKCALTPMALSSRWAELAPTAAASLVCADCGVAGGRHAEGCARIAA